MGAKISKAVDRRRNHAASDDRMDIATTSQDLRLSPTSLPTLTTDSPPTTAVDAITTPPSEQQPPSPLQAQHHISMENNALTRDGERETAAVLPPPPPPQMPVAAIPPPPPPGHIAVPVMPYSPIKIPEPRCLICTEELSAEKPAGPIVRPCRHCHSDYCRSCVKDMFIKACTDTTRMPPKCCNILQLHVALPMLSPNEAKLYRDKYEEWSTPNPMYCPVPTCSAFISNRLLPATPPAKKRKGKDRVDSVIGTPKDVHVTCPKCINEACVKCRQPAHPGTSCEALDFGVDKETAAALKRWGYKRCPKCGNGVRRMMGCNHMQCLCGAQWCWWCLVPMSECDGNCYDQEQDNDDMDADEVEELERERASKAAAEGADAAPLVPLVVAGTVNGRNMNLDIASNDYWDARGTNFGREPAEEPPDRAWQCEHNIRVAQVGFEERLKNAYQVAGMECSRCWSAVYPEITLPKKMANPSGVRMAGGYTRTDRSRSRGRDRGSRRGHTPARGPAHQGIGSQVPDLRWHLDLGLGDEVSGNASAPGNSPAPPQVIVDEYGDVIMTDSGSYTAQRSMSISGGSASISLAPLVTQNSTFTPLSASAPQKTNAFPTEFTFRSEIVYPPFHFAHECSYCGIILCNTCKDAVEKETQARQEAQAAAVDEEQEDDLNAQPELAAVNTEATSNLEPATSADTSNVEAQEEQNEAQAQPMTSDQWLLEAPTPTATTSAEQMDLQPTPEFAAPTPTPS